MPRNEEPAVQKKHERTVPLEPMALTLGLDQVNETLATLPKSSTTTTITALVVGILALLMGAGALILSMQHSTPKSVTDPRVDSLVVQFQQLNSRVNNLPIPADSASVGEYKNEVQILRGQDEELHKMVHDLDERVTKQYLHQ